ncbi:unnamed protein product [Polarella glacialis]|uniref:Uncharacterized protein n=1 Tax=Polarella glacialis TaxID=89957 RepID=A0A813D8X0_POLGL|nr:unnamed protein product [Polarella glacialis]
MLRVFLQLHLKRTCSKICRKVLNGCGQSQMSPSHTHTSSGQIPLIYPFFNGQVTRNASRPCGSAWTGTLKSFPDYFVNTLAVSLVHVPEVILLTDTALEASLREMLPQNLSQKLRVVDYLCYVDQDFFRFEQLYSDEIKRGPVGLKEPWEKMNYLNFFVLRTWMNRNQVQHVGHAEADVAVLVPPHLPTSCDSVVLWEIPSNKSPFYWAAWAAAGNVLSKDLMEDFIQFMFAMYSERKYQMLLEQKARRAP